MPLSNYGGFQAQFFFTMTPALLWLFSLGVKGIFSSALLWGDELSGGSTVHSPVEEAF